jgi:curved DNA-binding protein CbpA
MVSDEGDLSPALLGAEVLARLAFERAEGTLEWRSPDPTFMQFKAGRAERMAQSSERATLVAGLRSFARAAFGTYRFIPGAVAIERSQDIDTLGEAWVALAKEAPIDLVRSVVASRADLGVEAAPAFDKLVAAASRLGVGMIPRPRAGAPFGSLARGAADPVQRVWVTLIALGGLRIVAAAGAPQSAKMVARDTAAVSARPASTDPRSAGAIREIEAMHSRLASQSHYELLGVTGTAGVDEIKKAYFTLAKKWHSDSFVGIDLGPIAAKVEDIFRRIGEAHRVLADPAERKAYDFLRDRESQGLPTEPAVILQAESLFRRAESQTRRGQAAAALPLLEQAVQLNKGEAEFWIYLGFSLYSAKGSSSLDEAVGHIQKGLKMRENLDIGHEFLGKIARVEGKADEAMKHLRRAVEMNPKNKEAERELRLLSTRSTRGVPGPQNLTDLFKRLLKR